METPNKGTEITFEPYESEEDVIADGLSFDGAFQKEHIGFPGKTGIFLIVGAVLAVLGVFALILLAPRGDGHVVINEVMTSNKEAYAHPEHGSVDWIELYNPTENDVDLSGFGLTNDLKKQYKYRFPEGAILPAGGYLVVYCTGGTTASEEDPYCTGFALSRDGEGLFLLDSRYLEIDECVVPALATDVSYARTDDGGFRMTTTVTPGAANIFTD